MFDAEEDVRMFIDEFFMSRTSGFFVRGFTCLTERWDEVIELEGEYLLD